jgi:hypothetical protein
MLGLVSYSTKHAIDHISGDSPIELCPETIVSRAADIAILKMVRILQRCRSRFLSVSTRSKSPISVLHQKFKLGLDL